MKTDIHPTNYRPVVFEDLNNGQRFLTKSTAPSKEKTKWEDGQSYPLVKVHISSASHPYYTGQEKLIDVEGRVDKFKARQEFAAKARQKRLQATELKAPKAKTPEAPETPEVKAPQTPPTSAGTPKDQPEPESDKAQTKAETETPKDSPNPAPTPAKDQPDAQADN